MEGIVCIAGTNRPDNYTARALGIVVEAFRQSHVDPLVFDARTLSLAFPGHPDPGMGSASAPRLRRHPESSSPHPNTMAAFVR